MTTRTITRIEDLAGRGFPEHACTAKVAAELLMFASVHAFREWLRVHPEFPKRYIRTGVRTERIVTASECQRIRELRTLTTYRSPRSRANRARQAATA